MSGIVRAVLSASVVAFAFARAPEPVEAAEIVCTQWVKELDNMYPPEAYLDGILKGTPHPFPPICDWARLTGEIERGDYEKFRTFFTQHYLWLRNISLRSPGGNAGEALKIGSLMRRYLVTVSAPVRYENAYGGEFYEVDYADPCEPGPACICASSCALIWFGAVDRSGMVGIHRPKITDPEFAALPPDQAALVYRRTLDAVSRYLEDMEAPRSIIDRMRETGSADIFWIDGHERKFVHPPSFREWVDASCGSFSEQEEDESNTFKKRETDEEIAKRDELSRKGDRRFTCQKTLTYKHLRKLPPP